MSRVLPNLARAFANDGFVCPITVISASKANDYRQQLEDAEAMFGSRDEFCRGLRRYSNLLFTFVDEITRRPEITDVISEILEYLKRSIDIAISVGVDPQKIAIDPGIGFGKTDSHNLQILKNLERFKELAKPVLLGISRKSLIGNILNVSAEERLEGSLAAIVFGLIQGASIIRTHDVQATQRTIKVVQEIIKA